MSDAPGNTDFGVDERAVEEFAASLTDIGSLAERFPAVVLAPVWQAMLGAGIVVAPPRVSVDRAEVVPLGPNTLELRVPVSTVHGEVRKTVPVYVAYWDGIGDPAAVIADEAQRLAGALMRADAIAVLSHTPGQGQKPHN